MNTLYNPVYRRGVENFVKDAKEVGVGGLMAVDLPVEEAGEYLNICEKYRMGTIFLAAPNTSEDRWLIDKESSAFVYLVSLYGTTGAREKVSELAFDLIRRAKEVCSKPLAVGFGVSKPEHVSKLINAGADGVVVGSALVKIIEKYGVDATEELEKKVKELKIDHKGNSLNA